jgi:hypothetical protein
MNDIARELHEQQPDRLRADAFSTSYQVNDGVVTTSYELLGELSN